MTRSAVARLLPVGLPIVLLGSLALLVPVAESRAATACEVPTQAGGQAVRLDAAQVSNAQLIVGIAAQRQLPDRAAAIALATAMQEARLRNLSGGDGDSAGLFQQRPSAGWGTYADVTNPVRATSAFYSRLTALDGWRQMPLAVAAQAVQRSSDPSAYARWESFAVILVSELSDGLGGDCTATEQDLIAGSGGSLPVEQMGPEGLTPRTEHVLAAVVRTFGVTEIGGFCPGGCTRGHIPGSDHYTGHAVDVMLLPMTEANRRLGDRIALWLVANARTLAISYVIWHDHIWSASRGTEGWRPYTPPGGGTSPSLRHLDHVHVSVL